MRTIEYRVKELERQMKNLQDVLLTHSHSEQGECDCYCHYPIQVLTTSKAVTLRKECSHCHQPAGGGK